MSIARHLGLATLVVASWSMVGVPALAQEAEKGPTKAERATAREAYEKGTKAFEKGDYLKALDNFVKANALIPSVQAMFWIAQAQDKLGRTEAAIEAYEAVTARADFSKLSEDKATLVRERLAALKPPPPAPPPVETPPPAPPVETAPPPPEQLAPPAVDEPPPPPPETSPEPRANVVEVGATFGTMFVPDNHNLSEHGHRPPVPFESPVWQLGIRGAYFPMSYLGIEGEYVHGFGKVAEINYADRPSLPNNRTANFDALRAHVVGQVPGSRLVPFALLGVGMLHGDSQANGGDNDFAFQAGAGLKLYATRMIVPRADVRFNFTQKQGGGLGEGLIVVPEILLGLSLALGG